MAVLSFDYGAWSSRYPELASTVSEETALLLFAEAGLYCDNTDTSPIEDEAKRAILLGMVTAHLAALSAADTVGRVANVGQGSVSVHLDNNYPPGTVQWWQQSRYGAAFWAASQAYRTMTYIPGPARWFDRVTEWGA